MNRKGFSLIPALLILVIIGLLAGTGWYVWDSKNNSDKDQNSTSQTETKSGSTKPGIPEGYIKYENKDVGFSFAYPEKWGTLTFNKEENKRLTASFIKDGQYGPTIKLNKKIIEHVDTDDPTSNLTGYVEQDNVFTLLGPKSLKYETTLSSKDILSSSKEQGRSHLAYKVEGLIEGEFGIVGMGKLESNSEYDVVILAGPTADEMIKILKTFRDL